MTLPRDTGASHFTDPPPGYYYQPYSIIFNDDQRSVAVRAPEHGPGAPIVEALGLTNFRSALLVSGGAALMDPYDTEQMRILASEGIARFAEAHRVVVIDGGTATGVMRLLGEVRRQNGYHFPLVGVAPIGAVRYPGHETGGGETLDSGHSHFVFTDGKEFGQESAAMAEITRAIAIRGNRRGLSIIINGGEISRQETYDRTLETDRAFPLLVLDGSGRFANELAAAATGIEPKDTRVTDIVRKGEVKIVPMDAGADYLFAQLTVLLT
jgi:hypothetical protein